MDPSEFAFLSYSHHDEEHSGGFISGFRDVLAAEIRSALGEELRIFQDRHSLEWGDSWAEVVAAGISRSAFLIAFVTPSFLGSDHCRDEVAQFRDVERAQGRNDLILGVNFIDVPELRDPSSARTSERAEVARLLASRQAADFQEFRDRSPEDRPVRLEIRKLAESLARRIRRSRTTGGGSRPPPDGLYLLPDFVPRTVLGRDAMLDELTRALEAPRTVLLALTGDPGIGKTAVATQVARGLRRPTTVRYLAARGYPPVNAESVLAALATAIPDGRNRAAVSAPRATPLERLDAALGGLADRRVLLVVDDGGDLLDDGGELLDGALATLLGDLAQQDGHGVQVLLVTDRRPRSQLFRTVPMTAGLSRDEFRGFLRELDPRSEVVPVSERDRFGRVTRRWPRPAELIHGVVAGRRVSVAEVLDGVDRGTTLVQSAATGLSDEELAILRVLAVCGRPVPATAVTRLTGRDAGDVLARLADRRIVRRTGRRDEVSYHLPVAPGWPVADGETDLRRRAAEYFEDRCRDVGDEDVRLDDLGCYFDAIELYLACGDDQKALDLVRDVDDRYLAGRGQTAVLMPYLDQLAGTVTDTHSAMVTALMRARARVLLGDPGGSIGLAMDALGLADELQESDDVLIALSQVGTGYFEDGRVSEAAIWHGRVVQRGVGRLSRADAYHDLACCRLELGQPEQARELLVEARRELGRRPGGNLDHDDVALAAKIRLAEALVAFDLGEKTSCRRIADDARRAAVAVGAELDAARCDDIQAWASLWAGDQRAALQAARDAFDVGGRTGDPVVCRIAGVTLAVLHLLGGQFEDGRRAADVAVRSSRGHPAAGALAIRGVAELRVNRLQDAENWFERALSLAGAAARKEPGSYAAHEARGLALAGLALARERPDDDAEAAVAYREAVEHGRRPGAGFRRECMLNTLIAGRGPEQLPRVRAALGL